MRAVVLLVLYASLWCLPQPQSHPCCCAHVSPDNQMEIRYSQRRFPPTDASSHDPLRAFGRASSRMASYFVSSITRNRASDFPRTTQTPTRRHCLSSVVQRNETLQMRGLSDDPSMSVWIISFFVRSSRELTNVLGFHDRQGYQDQDREPPLLSLREGRQYY